MPWANEDEINGQQQLLLSRYLDTDGDGTGTKNAIGDYSTPEDFFIQPPAGVYYRINRILISIEDGVSFKAGLYGGLAALSVGITLKIKDASGTLVDFTDAVPVKTNGQWARLAYDVDLKSWSASPTEELLSVRLTFSKFGQAIRLDGDKGEKLVMTLSDNMTGLISHYFKVQGYVEESSTL